MGWDLTAYFPADQAALQEMFERHRGVAKRYDRGRLIAGEYFDAYLAGGTVGGVLERGDVYYSNRREDGDRDYRDACDEAESRGDPAPPERAAYYAEHRVYASEQTKWLNEYEWPTFTNPNYDVRDSASALEAADAIVAAFPDDPGLEWFARWLRATASLGGGNTVYVTSC